MNHTVSDLLELDKTDSDAALKMLYEDVWEMIVYFSVETCDKYMGKFVERESSTILKCGFARVTKPHKDKLKNREKLLSMLKESLALECSPEEAENVYSHVA